MSPDLDSFHEAARAYAGLRAAEAEITALRRQLQMLESTIESLRKVVSGFVDAHPAGQRMLDEHAAFLRRSGLLRDGPKVREVRAAKRKSESAAGPPRTAAATAAAAAMRRAFREQNPDAKARRSVQQRLALFTDGFARGYSDHISDPAAGNRFSKGDRARGWRVGADAARSDIAAGLVKSGATGFADPSLPPQAEADFRAFLKAAGVPESEEVRDELGASEVATQTK